MKKFLTNNGPGTVLFGISLHPHGSNPRNPISWLRRINTMITAMVAAALVSSEARAFRMGFTRWPSDITIEAFTNCIDFVHKSSDIVSVMYIGGIPWQEALDGKPYSKDVQENFAYKPPKGTKLFLSISPLDSNRETMAPYWGEKDNMPLPEDWTKRAFDSPEVIKAYTRFTVDAMKAMKPDYLALGIELNVCLSKDLRKWNQLKNLYRAVRTEVKKQNPTLPVFFTTEVNHYLKNDPDSKKSPQEKEVADLMQDSDLFAMSWYPFMSFDNPVPYDPKQLDFAKKFKKPIAVSECGMLSQDVLLKSFGFSLKGTPENQSAFLTGLFTKAQENNYDFIVQFASTDYEKLTAKLSGPIAELASIWQYTGIRTSSYEPKPAKRVWDEWLAKKIGAK